MAGVAVGAVARDGVVASGERQVLDRGLSQGLAPDGRCGVGDRRRRSWWPEPDGRCGVGGCRRG